MVLNNQYHISNAYDLMRVFFAKNKVENPLSDANFFGMRGEDSIQNRPGAPYDFYYNTTSHDYFIFVCGQWHNCYDIFKLNNEPADEVLKYLSLCTPYNFWELKRIAFEVEQAIFSDTSDGLNKGPIYRGTKDFYHELPRDAEQFSFMFIKSHSDYFIFFNRVWYCLKDLLIFEDAKSEEQMRSADALINEMRKLGSS